MKSLRDYQLEACDSIKEELESHRSTLLVLATGLGKTVVAAEMVKRFLPKRTMFLAHREELIFQAQERIEDHAGIKCAIEMAELKAEETFWGKNQCIISTIQTQIAGNNGGRMCNFDPKEFGLLVVDEAHHLVANSYKKVIDYYMQGNPDMKMLGLTATPDRTDEAALGQMLESVAMNYGILEGIENGYLVPVHGETVHVEGLDYSNIHTVAGDLNQAELAEVLEEEKPVHRIASAVEQTIGGRRALAFCVSVKQAERLSEIFNRPGSALEGKSQFIYCGTPKEERRQILRDFQAGKYQIVCNCGCLTEGFDNPGVELVVMARPTKSRSLFAQMVGRATRTLPGVIEGFNSPDTRKKAISESKKQSCCVLDFTGNAGKHKLVCTADLLGGNYPDEVVDAVNEKAKEGGVMDTAKALANEAKRQEERKKAEERRRIEADKRRGIRPTATFRTQAVNLFDTFDVTPWRERDWDNGKRLSEKQCDILRRQGIDPGGLSYTQGQQAIGVLMHRYKNRLCTMKQANLLKRHGYDPKEITMSKASELIDAIAKNGWRRPS